ncbi:cytochrome P450 2U1-like [Mercenaria mercenaria]|uniref:cytochrome P450 2U1-like n=1 Tax=Mercenaria mercenaria TaxID=6596 RepID=UPI00234E8C98|nr:cytochrome P450 2U1-like [Mercenaria mercenaria]
MDVLYLGFENLKTILVAFITLIIFYLLTRREQGVPPGPNRWPVVGNLVSLIGRDTLNILANLRMKYGDIYGIYFGSELTIFINGYDMIHEALVKRGTVFSKRPKNQQRGPDHVAIVFGNGASWKELRKFTLHAFRDLCFRKTGYTLEARITEELAHLTEKLMNFNNKNVEISHIVTLSFANVIYSILHGRRAGYDDAKFKWYLEKLDEAFKVHVRTQVLNACFPFLHYLPGDLLHEKVKDTVVKENMEYFDDICRMNYENYKPGDDNCFIDFWIAAKENNEIFRKENLWVILHDLMAAGSETTATTLKWVIIALAKYPYIQKKLQRKVDKVIDKGKSPSISDKMNLPYVEATILEALRFGSAVPLSVPHAVLHDTIFKGYKIPKEATILPNIFSVHFDPDIFPEPDAFRPERFLDEAEASIIRSEKLIPFSLGPRSCLGETLARMELFLYVTTLVQKLEFRAPDDVELPSLKGVFGLTRRPQDFKVKIHIR